MDIYSFSRVYFASTFVQECAYDLFSRKNHHHLINFIRDAAGNPFLATIRGGLFEAHAHQRLCSGENFKIQSLESSGSGSGEDETVNFGQLSTKDVSHVEDIDAGYYCKPVAKNFESIDSMIAPNTLFQITVAEKHPVKHNGLDKLKDKLATSGELRLYFVVPSDRYRGFQHQSYTNMDGIFAFQWIHLCLPSMHCA